MADPALINSLTTNEAKQCSITGCVRPRYKLCSRCRKHAERVVRWGNSGGHAWRASVIHTYMESAEDFLAANAEHIATVKALAFIDALLDKGRRAFEAQHVLNISDKTFGRLALQGITSEVVLARLLATTMYCVEEMSQRREPLRIEYQNNAGRFVLLLLGVVPNGGRSNQYAKYVGSALFSGLSKYLFAVIGHIQKLEAAQKTFENDCKQPFHTPPTT